MKDLESRIEVLYIYHLDIWSIDSSLQLGFWFVAVGQVIPSQM